MIRELRDFIDYNTMNNLQGKKTIYLLTAGLILLVISIIILGMSFRSGSASEEPGEIQQQEDLLDNTPWIGEEAVIETNEYHKNNAPDVYIRNKMPVNTNTFSIDYYVDKERETYVFTVIPKVASLQIVQQDLYEWLVLQGLNEKQIDALSIEYTGGTVEE